VLSLYAGLLAQFNRWKPITWEDAIVGLHIVYCWMPTIPNLARPTQLTPAERLQVVSLLNDARTRLLNIDELSFLKTGFINNSMVGLSKLLHFVAPERYAIWDKRVAKAWYSPAPARYATYNAPAVYLDYLATMAGWSPGAAGIAARAAIRALSPHLAAVSELRILELVLFHA
jgi:hypothetical protein